MDKLALIEALAAGALLGTLFFGGLWLTVQQLSSTQHPALLTLGSFLVRMALTVAGFVYIAQGQIGETAACLLGFVGARFVIVRLTNRPSNET